MTFRVPPSDPRKWKMREQMFQLSRGAACGKSTNKGADVEPRGVGARVHLRGFGDLFLHCESPNTRRTKFWFRSSMSVAGVSVRLS